MSGAALAIGRRILATGMAGSGKSTFSRSLAAKTGLPVIHLDLHFWKPGWVAPSEPEWREKQRGLLAGEAWIADGNYHETLDLRLERADTVVFLDTPWWVCAGRAFLRGLRKPVGEMPEGCDDSSWRRLRDEWRLAIVIWRNRRSEPQREREIISQYGQHAVLHALGSKRTKVSRRMFWMSSRPSPCVNCHSRKALCRLPPQPLMISACRSRHRTEGPIHESTTDLNGAADKSGRAAPCSPGSWADLPPGWWRQRSGPCRPRHRRASPCWPAAATAAAG